MNRAIISLVTLVAALSLSSRPAEAKCPTDGSPSREVCKYWSTLLTPALAGFAYIPGAAGQGPWLGGGMRLGVFTWSDNADRLGPGQGRLFFDLGLLVSGEEDTARMSLFRLGFQLSFEGNASRTWLIPYYGGAMGRTGEESLGVHWFGEAMLGVHALYTPNVQIDLEGGYIVPFSDVDAMSGAAAQLALSLTLW
ncbi:hypothetical protein [Haliangium ochraceum]|uniref:Outer membrane protein beta-barrel domain-containing protein n=1 Tax=Haliangium ochraceum (strain DSM 14365 / JCM 11303 / SMP-2) TaxID=502025 RepID=D0LG89_HALO1|nr:hypothetical protein [Haliangium ochraceum]ACY18114.1 hypothetical protein Hoch_5637 [Haliangium ochraceum DSM 14365]